MRLNKEEKKRNGTIFDALVKIRKSKKKKK